MFQIIGITGEQGDGKTALATKVAIEEYEKTPNLKVITNYEIKGIKSLTISFHDMVFMLESDELMEFIHDDVGNEIEFKPYYRSVYGRDPISVDDVFLDALVIFDELHIAADAYDFMGKSARTLMTFITQIRKRGIIFMGITQHLNQVAKRIRNHFQYIVEVQRTDVDGISYLETYGGRLLNDLVRVSYVDLSPYFNRYDTRRVVLFKPVKK